MSITKQLASCSPKSSSSNFMLVLQRPAPSVAMKVQARLSHEMSEQERAQELMLRKRHEMDAEGGETPSTIYGGSAVAMGMFSTGGRSKKLTEEETESIDNRTIMADSCIVKGVSSRLGELILGCHGVSVISLLSV